MLLLNPFTNSASSLRPTALQQITRAQRLSKRVTCACICIYMYVCMHDTIPKVSRIRAVILKSNKFNIYKFDKKKTKKQNSVSTSIHRVAIGIEKCSGNADSR